MQDGDRPTDQDARPSRFPWTRVLIGAMGVVLLAMGVVLGDRWHSYLIEECPDCASTRDEHWYVFGLVHNVSVVESVVCRAFFGEDHSHKWQHLHSHEFGGPKASSSRKRNWFLMELQRPGIVQFLERKTVDGSLTKAEVCRLCALPRRPTEVELASPETASGIRRAEALVVEAGAKPDYWWPRPK